MKKLLFITLTTIFAITSFAKTADELVKEFYATAKTDNDYIAAKTIVTNNAKDVEEALKAFVDTDFAKHIYKKEWTDEQKKNSQAMRMLLGQYLTLNKDKVKSIPLSTACIAASTFISQIMSVDNPNFYSELKANKFIVDGIELPIYAVINIAKTNKDYDTIIAYTDNYPVEQYAFIQSYIDALVLYSVNTKDLENAKEKIVELENLYILKNREIPSKLQAISKLLTSRLIDQKVRGKK